MLKQFVFLGGGAGDFGDDLGTAVNFLGRIHNLRTGAAVGFTDHRRLRFDARSDYEVGDPQKLEPRMAALGEKAAAASGIVPETAVVTGRPARTIVEQAAAGGFDLIVMVAVAVACLPIFVTGHRIARWEGGLFLAYYIAYTAYLVMTATEHALLPAFRAAMIWFVLPLTALTLLVLAVRGARGLGRDEVEPGDQGRQDQPVRPAHPGWDAAAAAADGGPPARCPRAISGQKGSQHSGS